jgi:hypothetical protein
MWDSVAIGMVVAAPVATAGVNDAARNHSASQQQRDHRDEFEAHGCRSSITVLVAIGWSRRISAIFQPPMLRPTVAFLLTFSYLSTVFRATRTAIIPVRLLNAM